jgi:hypothetical protein
MDSAPLSPIWLPIEKEDEQSTKNTGKNQNLKSSIHFQRFSNGFCSFVSYLVAY